MIQFIHSCLKVSLQIAACINDSYDNILGIENDFKEYLKESCWWNSERCISPSIFPIKCKDSNQSHDPCRVPVPQAQLCVLRQGEVNCQATDRPYV